MSKSPETIIEVTIQNRMGFHVRPVQRFAELARAFQCELEVELRGRRVPGKSILHLMSLAGRPGDRLKIIARGSDAEQCTGVLRILADDHFFVEDELKAEERPLRHIQRLCDIASCFRSKIEAVLNGKVADAKDFEALKDLGLSPASEPEFRIAGEDAPQARAVLEALSRCCFYVEQSMVEKRRKAQ